MIPADVVAVNVPHQLGLKRARHLIAAAEKLAGPNGVVFAVEMDAENDRAARSVLNRARRRVWFWRRKTQVITPRKWTETLPWKRTLTDAKAGVNPARDLNGVMDLRPPTTIWAATHPPNGKDKPGKSYRAWRQQQFDRYETRARHKVANKRARGWNWVIGGDTNDARNGVRFADDQVTLARAGLMRIVAIPAPGYRVLADNAETFDLPGADHPVLRVRNIRFIKGEKP